MVSCLSTILTTDLKSYHHCLSGMFTITAHPGVTITAYLGCQTYLAYLGVKVIMAYLEYHRHYRSWYQPICLSVYSV